MATLLHAPMDPSGLAPPPQSGLLRAIGLALVAHALLIAALTWGVNWKSQESLTVEAEIWSSVRQQAAPRAVEPPAVQPQPEPPKPQPKVEPPPAPPKVVTPPPPPDTSVRDAQIALERDKKKREEAKQRELAEEREEQQRKAAADRKREQQAQAKRDAQDKAEKAEKAEKAAADKAAKAERAEKAEKAEKAAEAKREQAIKAQQERDSNARRDEQLRRMQGLAGASGGATATGNAMQSSGPSASYGGKVAARVRPNIVFPDSVQGNPSAEVEVRSAPDGTIIGKRLIKSSGNKAWDDAVLRAIDKTETMPRDTDGRVPSLMNISFRPKE